MHDAVFNGGRFLKEGDKAGALDYFKKSAEESIRNIENLRSGEMLFSKDQEKTLAVKKSRFLYDLSRVKYNLKFLGSYFFAQKLWADAKDCFSYVLLVDPEEPNYNVYFNLGTIYHKLGDDKKAIESYSRAAEGAKYALEAEYCLSILYAQQGDKKKALEAMTKVMEKDPAYYDKKRK